MKLRRIALRTATVIALAWVAACVVLIIFARTLIYPFVTEVSAETPVGVPGAQVRHMTAADGTPLIVWLVPPQADRPVILYFMGNGGALQYDGLRLSEFVHRGFGVAALNYRGAGGAAGEPSQDALIADALTMYDTLEDLVEREAPAERRIIYGNSLGAALAIQLAARREAAAVILETPFNRLCEVAEIHTPIFPACLLLPYDRWPSADLIGQVKAPLLMLHGDADRMIPLSQGKALFEVAREPKRMIVYPGGRHNDLRLHGAGIDAIRFIEGLPKGPVTNGQP